MLPHVMQRRQLLKTLGTAATATAVTTATATAADGTYTDEYYDGYHYTKYVPSGASGGEPLLVMLHGCSQYPDSFARATQMNQIAEEENFVVIYPDQSSLANAYDCWNWYYDANTERGEGEGLTITNMAIEAVNEESLDDSRIYVAGFSAGAAMVPNLLASYADIYAAGGVHSGLEYDAANTATGATYAMSYGGPNPYDQGEEAYNAMEYWDVTSEVPTIVFHGTDDGTVDDVNGDQVRTQAVETNDLATDGVDDENVDTDPETRTYDSTGGYNYRRDQYGDGNGNTIVEYWLIGDMGHDWAGGASGEEYTAPDAPDASRAMWNFFSQWSQ